MANYEFVEKTLNGSKTSLYNFGDKCLYNRNRAHPFITYFRCAHRNCPARGNLKNGIFNRTKGHTHDSDDEDKHGYFKIYRDMQMFAMESDGDIKQMFVDKTKDVSLMLCTILHNTLHNCEQ